MYAVECRVRARYKFVQLDHGLCVLVNARGDIHGWPVGLGCICCLVFSDWAGFVLEPCIYITAAIPFLQWRFLFLYQRNTQYTDLHIIHLT